jgi:hypothetical protein
MLLYYCLLFFHTGSKLVLNLVVLTVKFIDFAAAVFQ